MGNDNDGYRDGDDSNGGGGSLEVEGVLGLQPGAVLKELVAVQAIRLLVLHLPPAHCVQQPILFHWVDVRLKVNVIIKFFSFLVRNFSNFPE